jgi:hypothetical protein
MRSAIPELELGSIVGRASLGGRRWRRWRLASIVPWSRALAGG